MNRVFRDYDQSALDREYDNRAKVADFGGFLQRYRQASEALRQQRPLLRDLAYAEHPAARLDLFPPSQATGQPAPVHVFIHGGYWKSLTKEDFSFTANAAPAALSVVLEYPLMPTLSMDGLLAACRQGLAWVHRRIAEFGGDPRRIVVSGHSAGGHLAAMLLTSHWPDIGSDLPADLLKAILGLSGLYDLEPIRRSFLNAELQLDDSAVETHSPVRLRPPGRGSVLLAVGDQEGPEYARQSQDLVNAWHPSTDIQLLFTPDHHFSIVSQLEHPDSVLARRLQTLLEGTAHATGPL